MPKSSPSILASVLLALVLFCGSSVNAFVSPRCPQQSAAFDFSIASESADDHDPNDIIARRIIVTGDVQGGYYRSCVRNEAGRFRRLSGTMTPPDDSGTAEIYVEGKRKMMDGFLRWCNKADVGLSQKICVSEILEEDPTGLYDDFYVKMQ
mmetsp:Transcript_9949/g.24824  ORF Transcript_9949/g.24824 Transcript_9949/m.24824 type:complete len:151 (-) Transcript_9949:263-715(-)|eukprot:CAMPEP_0116097338 /NCGR_PEP_ID=MMETSP0327-20121206/10657_1 /TAXON_ID=44447 /ORGANISM="Pseudo-nitzschia delicatissima, Strain B596" /LENGTH=150 /DNA_ID=CAMNT_0003589093 /DNA_START=94 /DNA_END=546 /DNA_ORIENTATION=+